MAAAPAGPACCDSLSLSLIRQNLLYRLVPCSWFFLFSPAASALRIPLEFGVISGIVRSPTSAWSQSELFLTTIPTSRATSWPTPRGNCTTILPSPPNGVLDALPSPASFVPPGSTAPGGGRHHSSLPSMTHAQCHSREPPAGSKSFCVSVTDLLPSGCSTHSMWTPPWVSTRSWPPKSTLAYSSKRTCERGERGVGTKGRLTTTASGTKSFEKADVG